MTRQQLTAHLVALLEQDAKAFTRGDWDALDFIRLCIDDTREQIEKLKKEQAS